MTNPACLHPLKPDFQSRIDAARATLDRAISLLVTIHKGLLEDEDQIGAAIIVELVEEAIHHADGLLCDDATQTESL